MSDRLAVEQELDSLRLDSPPGALPRAKHETFADSRKIFNAVTSVLERIASVMLTGAPDGDVNQNKAISSPDGASLEYAGNTIHGTRRVQMTRRIPDGTEAFVLESFAQGDGSRSGIYEPFVRIVRQVTTPGGEELQESGKGFDDEKAYDTYKSVTAFSGGVLHKGKGRVEAKRIQIHPSVIDPLAILDIMTHEFPQLVK